MPILLPEAILKVQNRERLEMSMKMDLLVLLLSKPCQFLNDIPQDWTHCLHVALPAGIDPDTGVKADWLDPEMQLRPALEMLVSQLLHTGRIPVDICAVKNDYLYAIVVRTVDPVEIEAA